jgi:hypothetical protein
MNYNEIGHESLEAFVTTTQKVVEDTQFDHLMAASDSGQLATHITTEIYDALGIVAPPAFIAPIFRHVDKARTIPFDNTIQAPNFSSWRNHVFNKTLFVDDEIWRGNTLCGILDLVMSLNIHIESLEVIAEDGGFNTSSIPYDIPLIFTPPKPRVTEIYNAFSYTVPEQYYKPVFEALGDASLNHKQIMCTLLDLPIKSRPNGMPRFSHHLLETARTVLPDLEDYKAGYRGWLRQTIEDYMD